METAKSQRLHHGAWLTVAALSPSLGPLGSVTRRAQSCLPPAFARLFSAWKVCSIFSCGSCFASRCQFRCYLPRRGTPSREPVSRPHLICFRHSLSLATWDVIAACAVHCLSLPVQCRASLHRNVSVLAWGQIPGESGLPTRVTGEDLLLEPAFRGHWAPAGTASGRHFQSHRPFLLEGLAVLRKHLIVPGSPTVSGSILGSWELPCDF